MLEQIILERQTTVEELFNGLLRIFEDIDKEDPNWRINIRDNPHIDKSDHLPTTVYKPRAVASLKFSYYSTIVEDNTVREIARTYVDFLGDESGVTAVMKNLKIFIALGDGSYWNRRPFGVKPEILERISRGYGAIDNYLKKNSICPPEEVETSIYDHDKGSRYKLREIS